VPSGAAAAAAGLLSGSGVSASASSPAGGCSTAAASSAGSAGACSSAAGALSGSGVAAASVEEQVRRLARLADASGLDGVVASPHEILPVRESAPRAGFLIVTPGVHPSAAAYADQKRVASPAEAMRRGADFIVVGRAILGAPDPAHAARAVVAEMEGGGKEEVDSRQ
jgi:orotidine-5'-phosphate decarboxylase